jgi:hypothetical protein
MEQGNPRKELWSAIQETPELQDIFVDEEHFDSLVTSDPKGVYDLISPSGFVVDYDHFESLAGLKKKVGGELPSQGGSDASQTSFLSSEEWKKKRAELTQRIFADDETAKAELETLKTAAAKAEQGKPAKTEKEKTLRDVTEITQLSAKAAKGDKFAQSTLDAVKGLEQKNRSKEMPVSEVAKLYEDAENAQLAESRFPKDLESGNVDVIGAYAPEGRLSQNIEKQREQKTQMLADHEVRLQRKFDAAKKAREAITPVLESRVEAEIKARPDLFKTMDSSGRFEVVNSDAIADFATNLAEEAGLGSDSNYRRLAYNMARQKAEFAIVEPEINKKFEGYAKDILGERDAEYERLATSVDAESQRVEADANLIASEMAVEADKEASSLKSIYDSAAGAILSSWEEQQKQINGQIAQINAAYESGAMDRAGYEAAFSDLESTFSQEQKRVQKELEAPYNEYVKGINEVNTRYQRMAEQEFGRIKKEAEGRIEKANAAFVAKYGEENPELKERLSAAYSRAYNEAYEEKMGKIEAAEEGDVRSGMYSGAGFMAVTLRNFTNGFGSAMSGWGAATQLPFLEDFGNYLSTKFVVGEAKSDSFMDVIDPVNFSRLSGQLAGSMAPSMVATATATALTGGAGAGALIAGGVVGWASETVDIAGRAYSDMFEATGGDTAAADTAKKRAVDSQVDVAWMYALDGLPFIKGGLSRVPTQAGRIATGAAVETGTEFLQEFSQNIASENIAAGRDPWENLMEKATDVTSAKKTLISIAPVALLGGAGQIGSKSRKQALADNLSAKFAQEKVNSVLEDQNVQYIQQMVFNEGEKTARGVATMLYAGGQINEKQLAEMNIQISDAVRYDEAAKGAKLSPNDRAFYSFFATRADAAKRAASTTNDPILSKVYDNQAKDYEKAGVEFLSGAKPRALSIKYKDGTEFLMTHEDARNAFANPMFADEVKKGNVAVAAFDEDGKRIIDDAKKAKIEPTPQAEARPVVEADFGAEPSQEIVPQKESAEEAVAKFESIEANPDLTAEEEREMIRTEMRPFAQEASDIEREFSNAGYTIDWDYDNEMSISDKDGNPVEDIDEIPDNLKERATRYEEITQKLADYDSAAWLQELNEARKAEDAEFEVIEPTALPQTTEENVPLGEVAVFKAVMPEIKRFLGQKHYTEKDVDSMIEEGKVKEDCPPGTQKAQHGAKTGFVPGGKWEIVKEFKGKTHEEGGIDIEISGGSIKASRKEGEFNAKRGGFFNVVGDIGKFIGDLAIGELDPSMIKGKDYNTKFFRNASTLVEGFTDQSPLAKVMSGIRKDTPEERAAAIGGQDQIDLYNKAAGISKPITGAVEGVLGAVMPVLGAGFAAANALNQNTGNLSLESQGGIVPSISGAGDNAGGIDAVIDGGGIIPGGVQSGGPRRTQQGGQPQDASTLVRQLSGLKTVKINNSVYFFDNNGQIQQLQ